MNERADRSGGLNWHLRAFWRRRVLWQPFQKALAGFLDQWNPTAEALILVGPSAGWCLPDPFLSRFTSITAIDPDPWAGPLFRLIHPRAALKDWIRGDFFAEADRLLTAQPKAAVLFCNVLGQLRFSGLKGPDVQARIAQIAPMLAGHPWASFHEIMSGVSMANPPPLALPGARDHRALLQELGLSGEWLDHEASTTLPAEQPRIIVPWRFAPDRLHLVEMGIGGL